MKMFQVMTREEAFAVLLQAFPAQAPCCVEKAAGEAIGAVLARDIASREDIPLFRRSAVDGYAVRARDTNGASEASPALLRLCGQVAMGAMPAAAITAQEAVGVPTGGALPDGADAMVMVEHTERLGEEVAVFHPAAVRDHVVDAGEDVAAGATVLSRGTRLRASHLGLLAALGVERVAVAAAPRVAILSTGDELVPVGAPVRPGQVRDSNRAALAALVEQVGATVAHTAHVGDDPARLRQALETALSQADLVLLSGGSSVGGMDHTESVLSSFGKSDMLVHGLAMKPGKPTLIASIQDKPVFGLPGHPAACVMVFHALVAPFLATRMGLSEPLLQQVPCVSRFQLHAAGGREVFQMVRLLLTEDGWEAEAVHGKSGFVSQIASADAFVIISRNTEGIRPGDRLWAYLLP